MKCIYCGSDNVWRRGRRGSNYRFKCVDEEHPDDSPRWFSIPIGDPRLLKDKKENSDNPDEEIVGEAVRQAKRAQKFQDLNRIRNKTWREYIRIDNAIEEYSKSIIDLLEEKNLSDFTIKHEDVASGDKIGVIQFSDWHLNELIDERFNKSNYKISSKKLKKLVSEAKDFFKAKDVGKVFIAITGDLVNNDNKLDALVSNSDNRSKGSLLTVYLLEQIILDLNKDFNITVSCVVGNESRIQEDFGYNDYLLTDNYDFSIFNIIRMLFKDSEGVNFVVGDPSELVVNIAGHNLLMMHGNSITRKTNLQKTIQNIVGKYSSNDVKIDYVIFGHIHFALVGDTFSRSSSLCGGSNYSNSALHFSSRASQNLYIFGENEYRVSMVVDLENVDGLEGYDIKEELEAFVTTLRDKNTYKETIFKVVI